MVWVFVVVAATLALVALRQWTRVRFTRLYSKIQQRIEGFTDEARALHRDISAAVDNDDEHPLKEQARDALDKVSSDCDAGRSALRQADLDSTFETLRVAEDLVGSLAQGTLQEISKLRALSEIAKDPIRRGPLDHIAAERLVRRTAREEEDRQRKEREATAQRLMNEENRKRELEEQYRAAEERRQIETVTRQREEERQRRITAREERDKDRASKSESASKLQLTTSVLTIGSAKTQNLAELEVRGSGLQHMDLEVESLSEQPLEIEIDAGVVFKSDESSVQNMVCVDSMRVPVSPYQIAHRRVRVACANMWRSVPTMQNNFQVVEMHDSENLQRLLNSKAFQQCNDPYLMQYAVWTITDNPPSMYMVTISTGSLASIGLGDRIECDGPMRERIGLLFDAAGIPKSAYLLFNPRLEELGKKWDERFRKGRWL